MIIETTRAYLQSELMLHKFDTVRNVYFADAPSMVPEEQEPFGLQ